MAGNCGKITKGISIDCDNPIVGGVKDRLILINQDDLSGLGVNVTNSEIIEAITLASGSPAAKAYSFEGKNSSIDVTATFVKAKYSEGYTHQSVFRVFGNSSDIKKTIEALGKGKYYAIIENNYKGNAGDASFEFLGKSIGLEMTAMESNKSDAETQGAYVVTLATPADFKEPHLPATVFITDYATTKIMVNALL